MNEAAMNMQVQDLGEHLCPLCCMCSGEELLGSVSSEDIVQRFSKEAVTKSTGTRSGITFPPPSRPQ